jgi:hypothetical protein
MENHHRKTVEMETVHMEIVGGGIDLPHHFAVVSLFGWLQT